MDYRESILWNKAVRLAAQAVALSRRLPREERFGMRSQLTRAATSIPSNVAEGWVRETWREKIHFLAIAHGSLAELHTHLVVCSQVDWMPAGATADAEALIDEVGRMITALKRRWRDKPGRAPTPPTT